jgi:hypothetical protein
MSSNSKESVRARFTKDFKKCYGDTPIINWYTLDQLKAFYREMKSRGTESATRLYGVSIDELRSFIGSKGSKDGEYWADWVTCLISHLKVPQTGHPRLQRRTPPEGVDASWRARWKEVDYQAKLGVHHISWILKNGKDMPGLESSVVEHLCDVQGCFRKSHMGPISGVAQNLERAYGNCPGTVLVVYGNVILKEEVLCTHEETCIKLLVVKM